MQYKQGRKGLFLSEFLSQAVQAGQYRPVSERLSASGSTRRTTRKSVHRTWMPPPNAIQKKGLYVTVTGIP